MLIIIDQSLISNRGRVAINIALSNKKAQLKIKEWVAKLIDKVSKISSNNKCLYRLHLLNNKK